MSTSAGVAHGQCDGSAGGFIKETRGFWVNHTWRWLVSWSSRRKLFIGVVALVVFLDQLSKYWAIANLTRAFDSFGGGSPVGFVERMSRFLWYRHPVHGAAVAVLEHFWHFRYAENPGAAWSFLAAAPDWFRAPFFLFIALVAMVFIVVYYRRTTASQLHLRLALALVFGGALGNFLDRLRLGYVIDFVEWHWYDRMAWPTFNVADAAISIGVALMLLDMFMSKHPERAGKGEQVRAGGSR